MKKLDTKVLNSSEMSKLFGGKEIATSKSGTNASGCQVITTDSFQDTNGNGKHDKNESMQECTVVNCPN
ncbi:hypothetical protein [uncultured Chryseobacterium sp.]|uniref:hypothetical protein n=1 Tax=uncultured Chryseobacterium sp. TaxID=259322 RepID=UPI0025ED9667|nr:hypothetical protein [uncultured Chryseobacterium sp.]